MKTITQLNSKIAKLIQERDKQLAKEEALKQFQEHQKILYKGKEFRIYKWENKPFKDFVCPNGFSWCPYFDFVELINDKKITLDKYPSYYYTINQFKSNIKLGHGLSRLYLFRSLYLGSDNGYLADSGSGGRVVVIKNLKSLSKQIRNNK